MDLKWWKIIRLKLFTPRESIDTSAAPSRLLPMKKKKTQKESMYMYLFGTQTDREPDVAICDLRLMEEPLCLSSRYTNTLCVCVCAVVCSSIQLKTKA